MPETAIQIVRQYRDLTEEEAPEVIEALVELLRGLLQKGASPELPSGDAEAR